MLTTTVAAVLVCSVLALKAHAFQLSTVQNTARGEWLLRSNDEKFKRTRLVVCVLLSLFADTYRNNGK
jgi:hypothetical protein